MIFRPFLLLPLLLVTTVAAQAQRWQPRIGLNMAPLLDRSLEATYELTTPNRGGAVFLNVGETVQQPYTARVDFAVNRLIEEFHQKTSGLFIKSGGKLFFNQQHRVKGFLGLQLTASHYINQNRWIFYATARHGYIREKNNRESDWSVAVGALTGINVSLTQRFDLDLGIQVAKPLDQIQEVPSDYLPISFRPGIGSGRQNVPLQGILALKYRL